MMDVKTEDENKYENTRIYCINQNGKGVIYMNLNIYPLGYTNDMIVYLLGEMVQVANDALTISNNNGFSTFNLEINARGVKSKQLNLQFAKLIAETMKVQFPDKLDKCNIYQPPAFFEVMFDLIKAFIDRKTQQKINVVKNII